MSSNDLYQEVILDHYKHPRNCGCIAPHSHEADGQNPLCGDELTVYVDIADGVIRDISFEGQGCAISQASASLMTEALKGKPLDEALTLHEQVHQLITGTSDVDPTTLGKLQVMEGVSDYPMRVKCASLAWHTMKAAITRDPVSVSTE